MWPWNVPLPCRGHNGYAWSRGRSAILHPLPKVAKSVQSDADREFAVGHLNPNAANLFKEQRRCIVNLIGDLICPRHQLLSYLPVA